MPDADLFAPAKFISKYGSRQFTYLSRHTCPAGQWFILITSPHTGPQSPYSVFILSVNTV